MEIESKIDGFLSGMLIGNAIGIHRTSKLGPLPSSDVLLSLSMIDSISKSTTDEMQKQAMIASLAKYGATTGRGFCDEITEIVAAKLAKGEVREGAIGVDSYGPLVRAITIGALFSNFKQDQVMVSRLIDTVKMNCQLTHEDARPQCTSISVALMVYYSMKGIPVGTWLNELSYPLAGVDNQLLRILDLVLMAYSTGGAVPICTGSAGVLANAFYCILCARNDYWKGIGMVYGDFGEGTASALGSIVGACLGSSTGMDQLSKIEVPEKLKAAGITIDKFKEEEYYKTAKKSMMEFMI